jgi:hypothetical protein
MTVATGSKEGAASVSSLIAFCPWHLREKRRRPRASFEGRALWTGALRMSILAIGVQIKPLRAKWRFEARAKKGTDA